MRCFWARPLVLALLSFSPTAVRAEPIVLDLRAESGLLGRSFRYTDPLADHRPDLARPADNVVPATPTLRLRLESYPLAPFTSAWLAHWGLHLDVSGALPTTVHSGTGEPAQGSQTQGQLQLGTQARIDWGAVELVPRAAWGLHGSYLRWDGGTAPPFPDVTYSYLEFGARLRGTVETVTFEGQLAVRPVLSVGGVGEADWFPNTTALGVVTGASAGWAFHPALSLRVSVDFVQYGLSFHPDVGQPPERVAGGATDQSVAATLGLEWRLASPTPAR